MAPDSAVFDEENLVSHAGLVPVLELAERAGLSDLCDAHVGFADERVRVSPSPTAVGVNGKDAVTCATRQLTGIEAR